MQTTVRADQRFTPSHPCPICGGHDRQERGEGKRCHGFLSADGAYAHCSREEHAGGLPLDDADTYAHRLAGDCRCGVRHGPDATSNGHKPGGTVRSQPGRIVATYDYRDAAGKTVYQVVRYLPKRFRQRRPDGVGGWIWNIDGVVRVPYRLPEVLAAKPSLAVWLCEGEKDADNLATLGLIATTTAQGARSLRQTELSALAGRVVVILPHNDDDGRTYAETARCVLIGLGCEVRVLPLPGLATHGDLSDWLDSGGTASDLRRMAAEAPVSDAPCGQAAPETDVPARLEWADFLAFLPDRSYIYVPNGSRWGAKGIDRAVDPVAVGVLPSGAPQMVMPSEAITSQRPVHTQTWAPGEPTIIADRFLDLGGWADKTGIRTYNGYRPARIVPGNADAADLWTDHVWNVYPEDTGHILDWFAHRVQRPGEKVNHALVLGGAPGIGKDTILEPVRQAIGPWNAADVSPAQLAGRFNAFLMSVLLRVSEIYDLGEINRFGFYELGKTFIASPPDTMLIDEKNVRAYRVPNVTGVVFTTNHRTDGLYLPADDRRHYVAWSERQATEFPADYWTNLYRWFDAGGHGHVAAFLRERDLSDFDPKAPPSKTRAFWDIVDASRAPEDAELADALDWLGNPDAVTVPQIIAAANRGAVNADSPFAGWLRDRKNSRQMPHRFEAVGYTKVRNPDTADGMWKANGRRMTTYVRQSLAIREQIVAARRVIEESRSGP